MSNDTRYETKVVTPDKGSLAYETKVIVAADPANPRPKPKPRRKKKEPQPNADKRL